MDAGNVGNVGNVGSRWRCISWRCRPLLAVTVLRLRQDNLFYDSVAATPRLNLLLRLFQGGGGGRDSRIADGGVLCM